SLPATTVSGGASAGISLTGTSVGVPSLFGSAYHLNLAPLAAVPRRPLGGLVTTLNEKGLPDPTGKSGRAGASVISRSQGKRYIGVKFSVRGRDLASTVAEAQEKVAPLLKPPYRDEWTGEFQEMEEAEHRLLVVVSVSLVLIFIFLYLAFRSVLDALV